MADPIFAIKPDLKKIVNDLVEGEIKGALKAGLSALGSGVGGLGSAFASSIEEASKYEDAVASLDAMLQSTNKTVRISRETLLGVAEELEQTTIFSDETAISAEKVMLTFSKVGKQVFPEAMRVSGTLSLALGQDLQSSVKQVGQALNDPIQGVLDLEKAGVSFTEEQKSQIEILVESKQVQMAQREILRTLEEQYGTAAKTAGGTFSSQLIILKNSFGDLFREVGGIFLPLLRDLLHWVNDIVGAFRKWAQENKSGIGEALQEVRQQVGKFVQAVVDNLPGVWKTIQDTWAKIQPSLGALVNLFQTVVLPAIQQFIQWVAANWPRVQQAIEGLWARIQPLLGALADLFRNVVMPAIQRLVQWVAENLPLAQKAFEEMWTRIKPALEGIAQALGKAWQIIQPILQAFMNALGKFWAETQPKLEAAWNRIVQVITQACQNVWNIIKPIVETIQQFIQGVMTNAEGFVQAHFTEIKAIIEGVMNYVSGFIQVVWSLIQGIIKIALDLISGDTTAATKSWDEMLTGVMDGLKKMFDGAWAAIQTTFALALQALVDAITTKAAEISTAMGNAISGAVSAITSRVADFFSAAAKLVLGDNQDGNGGIVGGIRAVATQIATEMGSAINSAKDAITARIGDFFNAAKELIVGTEEEKGAGGLVGGIKSQVEAITSALGGAIDIAKGAIATRIGDFFNAAKELIVGTEEEKGAGGLVGGIKSKLEDVKKAVEDLISGAADKLATLPQDIKDKFADIGGKIVGGIKDKIAGMGDDLATALKSAIKAALETIRTALTSSDNPVAQAVTKQINDAIDWIEQKLGIASPSKVFAKIGAEMAAGLAEGFATAPLSATLAAGTMAMGLATSNAIYNQQHYYNLTIHSNASTEQVVADFAMLRALAGA